MERVDFVNIIVKQGTRTEMPFFGIPIPEAICYLAANGFGSVQYVGRADPSEIKKHCRTINAMIGNVVDGTSAGQPHAPSMRNLFNYLQLHFGTETIEKAFPGSGLKAVWRDWPIKIRDLTDLLTPADEEIDVDMGDDDAEAERPLDWQLMETTAELLDFAGSAGIKIDGRVKSFEKIRGMIAEHFDAQSDAA